MENQSTKPNNDREIDLLLLFQSLGDFMDRVGLTLYRSFLFLKKNFIISILLVLLGIAWAYYAKITDPKAYKHTVLVVTNFGSNTFLYNEIDNFKYKYTKESEILKSVSGLELKPVIDVFNLVSTSELYLSVARYMSDNSIDVNKFKKDNNVELLYKYHILTYYTNIEDTDGKINKALFDELNDDTYFLARQKIEVLDTQNKLVEQEKSIANINGLFEKIGNVSDELGKNVSVEMYSEINDLLQMKEILLKEINKTKVSISEQSKIIFDASKKLNVNNEKGIISFVIYPFILLVLFVILGWIGRQINRYKATA